MTVLTVYCCCCCCCRWISSLNLGPIPKVVVVVDEQHQQQRTRRDRWQQQPVQRWNWWRQQLPKSSGDIEARPEQSCRQVTRPDGRADYDSIQVRISLLSLPIPYDCRSIPIRRGDNCPLKTGKGRATSMLACRTVATTRSYSSRLTTPTTGAATLRRVDAGSVNSPPLGERLRLQRFFRSKAPNVTKTTTTRKRKCFLFLLFVSIFFTPLPSSENLPPNQHAHNKA